MGLPNSDDGDIENSAKRFSDDILRIEIFGPDQHHMSVVDVPGLFHNPTKYQTREDLSIIRRLIESYTTDARTIIFVEDALRGNYATDLDVKSKLKLRMHLRDLAEQFEKEIRTKGHTLPFETADGSIDPDYFDSGDSQESANIMEWIRERYRDARGAELPGTVNPVLLVNLFRQQTTKWQQISEDYLKGVVELMREYCRLECRRTEHDGTIRSSLESMLLAQIECTEASARLRLMDILNDERGGILQTVNHYFAETLDKIRKERVIARFKALGIEDSTNSLVNLGGLTDAMHLSNVDQAVIDIHDVLKAYYKVRRLYGGYGG
ncbi:hypothetical protein PLIIFM63780_010627 [Purpureocillium lilacinum]|nr:hypothetical protein PLIIFM63780_010627 [Purpureocillium lilacinum]